MNAQNNMTGIYVEYHDSLSWDAFKVWVYQNGNNLLDNMDLLKALCNNSEYQLEDALKEKKRTGGIRVMLMTSSSHYNTVGLRDAVRIIKNIYPELPVKCFTEGWYTFPGQWKEVGDYFTKHLSPEVEMVEGRMKIVV